MADSDVAPDAPAQPSIGLDALDSHLMRRAKFFENEALMLAINLRDVIAAGQVAAPPRKAAKSARAD